MYRLGCSWARYGVVERRTRVHGCAARASFVAGEGYRYISNEYTLHGGTHSMYDTHLCPQFVNVVMLRWALGSCPSRVRTYRQACGLGQQGDWDGVWAGQRYGSSVSWGWV